MNPTSVLGRFSTAPVIWVHLVVNWALQLLPESWFCFASPSLTPPVWSFLLILTPSLPATAWTCTSHTARAGRVALSSVEGKLKESACPTRTQQTECSPFLFSYPGWPSWWAINPMTLSAAQLLSFIMLLMLITLARAFTHVSDCALQKSLIVITPLFLRGKIRSKIVVL